MSDKLLYSTKERIRRNLAREIKKEYGVTVFEDTPEEELNEE